MVFPAISLTGAKMLSQIKWQQNYNIKDLKKNNVRLFSYCCHCTRNVLYCVMFPVCYPYM